jgi:hypothetical protein
VWICLRTCGNLPRRSLLRACLQLSAILARLEFKIYGYNITNCIGSESSCALTTDSSPNSSCSEWWTAQASAGPARYSHRRNVAVQIRWRGLWHSAQKVFPIEYFVQYGSIDRLPLTRAEEISWAASPADMATRCVTARARALHPGPSAGLRARPDYDASRYRATRCGCSEVAVSFSALRST